MKFIIATTFNGQYYFRLETDRSEPLCLSAYYNDKHEAERAIETIRNEAFLAKIINVTYVDT
jgi:uncharacterized protein YegP (UPF0339 family)